MQRTSRPPPTKSDSLLRTKLAPPVLEGPLIERRSLLARLEAGAGGRLVLVSAPAGAGKTTLAAQWAAAAGRAVAWVTLDAGDSDPVRFWRQVVAACQVFDAELARAALPPLSAVPQPAFEPFLAAFLNQAAGWTEPLWLILDDYQAIASDTIDETLGSLVTHLPANLRVMLITRRDPALPLGRLRARSQLVELRGDDLRLSGPEIERFMAQRLPAALAPGQLERLEAKTEGWAAALQLIAYLLQTQGSAQIDRFLSTLSGSHRAFVDYVAGEVLAAQPNPTQQFLLQSSGLRRFNAALCGAVTGREDSGALLQELERDNLFVVPLGAEGAGRWYRYHSLFGEALRAEAERRLGAGALREASARASRWHAANGFLDEAIEAALEAEAYEPAAELVERRLQTRAFRETDTLRRWLQRLPEPTLAAHPLLAFNYAEAQLYTAQRRSPATVEVVETPLGLAERRWEADGNQTGLAQALTLRASLAFWQSDHARAYTLARQALELLPDSEPAWRGTALVLATQGELSAGRIAEAQRLALEARATCAASLNRHAELAATLLYGHVCAWNGQLHQAAHIYQHVLQLAEHEDDPSDRAWAQYGLARLHYEWDDLEAAEAHASEAARTLAGVDDDPLRLQAAIVAARSAAAAGRAGEAAERLNSLIPESTRWPEVHREVLAWQARLWLARGDLAAVRQWQAQRPEHGATGSAVLQELDALTAARWLIASRQVPEALETLAHWQAEARANGRTRSEIETWVLQALAHFAARDLPQARTCLAEALDLAQQGDWRRVFLDEGAPLAALLQRYVADREARLAPYARRLMFATRLGQPEPPLLEPLSNQERRVLRLLAAGLSNPEIAEELVVSVNTIKTQVRSIYQKLGVRDRETAREAAQALRLL